MSKPTPYLEINDLVFLDNMQSMGVVRSRVELAHGIDKRYLFNCRYVGDKGGLMTCTDRHCKNEPTCAICSCNVYAAIRVSKASAAEYVRTGLLSPVLATLAR